MENINSNHVTILRKIAAFMELNGPFNSKDTKQLGELTDLVLRECKKLGLSSNETVELVGECVEFAIKNIQNAKQ